MERPNGRRIILKFNSELQPIGDKAGLLSDILSLLGIDYEKFHICEESWHKITTKDKIYKEFSNRHLSLIDQQKKCRKNAMNQWKQKYTYTGGSKSLTRRREEEERIHEIEQHDESSRVLSQNDSLAQTLEKENQVDPNSHPPGNGVQVEETQRKLLELQAELEAEKLKKKAMEDEVTTEKKKRQAMKSALRYLFQWQSEELPPDIAAGMSSVEG
ncbi:hypothetical protein Ahy_B06g083852 [Arachis hypogaea]|uniref:Uncharacterized protein n=1 Tax=Arachis hypogaea TaxID=3818 RepID=A0A444YQI7_ARAHY|nr:hypothetical protein Ahy_B06g083852 [Arachis hypogaea]